MAGIASITVVGLPEFELGMARLWPVMLQGHIQAMRLSTLLVERVAKSKVHRKTGILAGSITTKVETSPEIQGEVGTDVSYARDVETGTGPHDISPVQAQALMLPVSPMGGFGGGRLSGRARSRQQVAFYARVHHPGSKPHPFLEPALIESRPAIQELFNSANQNALNLVVKAMKGLF